MNLASFVHLNALRRPQAPALIERRETWSYAELDRRIALAAVLLVDAGIGPGQCVAILAHAARMHLVLLLAASKIGAASCTIDRQARPAEREAILATIRPRLLLADRPQAAGIVPVLLISEADLDAPAAARESPTVDDPDLPALLLLTSGSTGHPKAMVLTQRAAIWRAKARVQEFDVRPDTRLLTPLSPAATAGIQILLAQLLAGGTTYLFPAIHSPEEILEALLRERIDHATLVPTTARWMLELPAQRRPLLPDIKNLLVTGAAFHPGEIQAVLAGVTPNLHVTYGASGAGGITIARPDDLRRQPTSVGRPWANVAIDIVDARDQVLAAGETGRIRVRTGGAASGYLGASAGDERGEIFHDDHVFPGDLGRLDTDGYLYLEGRVSSLLIRGGQNVYPEEIERALQACDAVAEAAVLGLRHAALGEVPVAFVVLRSAASSADLQAFCRLHLSSHKMPAHFHILEALPRTPAGKINRAALQALLPA